MTKKRDQYGKYLSIRKDLELPIKLDHFLQVQQSLIKAQVSERSSFVGCYTKTNNKKFNTDEQFVSAFTNLTYQQKVEYYIFCVKFLKSYYENTDQQPNNNKVFQKKIQNFEIELCGGAFNRSWVKKTALIDTQELRATLVQNSNESIDLRSYMLRKSKNQDRYAFVLQAIKPKITKMYRIGLEYEKQFDACFQVIKAVVEKAHQLNMALHYNIRKELTIESKAMQRKISHEKRAQKRTSLQFQLEAEKNSSSPNTIQQLTPLVSKDQEKVFEQQQHEINHTISQDLIENSFQIEDMKERIQEENDKMEFIKQYEKHERREDIIQIQQEDLDILRKKQSLDIFHRILPNYQLQNIDNEQSYTVVQTAVQNPLLRILAHKSHKRFKLMLTVNHPVLKILQLITNIKRYPQWNSCIQLSNIEMRITSQNSQILYMKHKAYTKFYRERDYIFIRHFFKQRDIYYMVDKSIQNAYTPPFNRIERGEIVYAVWAIKMENSNVCKLILDIQMDHKGYLGKGKDLTILYISQLAKLEGYAKNMKQTNIEFNLEWDISKNQQNSKLSLKKLKSFKNGHTLFQQNLCSEINQQFKTINNNSDWDGIFDHQDQQIFSMVAQQELNPRKQIQQPKIEHITTEAICQLDHQGYALLTYQNIKVRHFIHPVKGSERIIQPKEGKHYLWRNLWQVQETGEIKCIDQAKLKQQSGIFSHVLKTIGKNLLSGKNILNISLPVQIFSELSNLELIARSFGMAAKVLQKASTLADPVERFKNCMIFGLTTSLLTLQMQKPFNPILGQTYQGWINGCPVYCQQISHHPPISAFYMQGRGFKIYGNIEPKISLGLNSGTGYNDGVYVIEFEKFNSKVRFRSPGGQIKGLVSGDRTFLLTGKQTFWDDANALYCELIFNPTKKMMGWGKQQKPSDYVQGQIYQVRKQYFNNPVTKSPSSKQILRKVSLATGRWTQSISFDNSIEFLINRDIPYQLQQEKYPLHSNSNYREDVVYRRKKDYARARIEKQRLENLQRADKKLREKNGKSKH